MSPLSPRFISRALINCFVIVAAGLAFVLLLGRVARHFALSTLEFSCIELLACTSLAYFLMPIFFWCLSPMVAFLRNLQGGVILSNAFMLGRRGREYSIHQNTSMFLRNATREERSWVHALSRIRELSVSGKLGGYDRIIIPSGFISDRNFEKLDVPTRPALRYRFLENVIRLIIRRELLYRSKLLGVSSHAREAFTNEGMLSRSVVESGEFCERLDRYTRKAK